MSTLNLASSRPLSLSEKRKLWSSDLQTRSLILLSNRSETCTSARGSPSSDQGHTYQWNTRIRLTCRSVWPKSSGDTRLRSAVRSWWVPLELCQSLLQFLWTIKSTIFLMPSAVVHMDLYISRYNHRHAAEDGKRACCPHKTH